MLRRVSWLVSLSSALLASPAGATQITPLPLSEVLARADAVVLGTVAAQRTVREAGGALRTETTIAVERCLAGSCAGRREHVVSQLGGTWGGRVAEVVGDVRFVVGQRVLVMTRRAAGDRSWVVGLSQGAFLVDGDRLYPRLTPDAATALSLGALAQLDPRLGVALELRP